MVKGKIHVLAGGVIAGRGGKPVQVALSERSTAREVVSVILKKYGLQDDPFGYQVWVVCPPQPGEPDNGALHLPTLAYPPHSTVRLQTRPVRLPVKPQCLCLVCVRRADHVLGDQESPLAAKLSWKGPTDHAQFHLRRRSSGMVRVFAQLSEGYETFHNIIVQPHASTREVVQQLVDRYFRKWSPRQLELVEVTPQAGVCSYCMSISTPTPHTLYGILWWL